MPAPSPVNADSASISPVISSFSVTSVPVDPATLASVFGYTVGSGVTVDPNAPFSAVSSFYSSAVAVDPNVLIGASQYQVSLSDDIRHIILSANHLKAAYNDHINAFNVHMQDDTVNVVVLPDAWDLDSAILLLNDIKAKYNSHRTQSGVHANVAIIRFTAPDRVLYSSISLFTEEAGTPELLSSFSDDGGGSP